MPPFRPEMSPAEKIKALGEGNSGALEALREMHESHLDLVHAMGITGADLHILYTVVCEKNSWVLARMLTLAEAGVLGLNAEKLLHAARNQGEGLDFDVVVKKIDEIGALMRRRIKES